MIAVPEIVLGAVAGVRGSLAIDNAGVCDARTIAATGCERRHVAAPDETLYDLALQAARRLPAEDLAAVGGVVAATFSDEWRFPSLGVRLAGALGIGADAPVIDLNGACAVFPAAVYSAGRLAHDLGRPVLLVDGDRQSAFVDPGDRSVAPLFSDAAVACLVYPGDPERRSAVAFCHRADDALACPAAGPVAMDGFRVFSFVAGEATRFLAGFLESAGGAERIVGFFPHHANLYLVRQLARRLGLSDRLHLCGGDFINAGSCSMGLALADFRGAGEVLLAGFGAGLCASAAIVTKRA